MGPRDPKNAEKRRKGQSRGGRGSPDREISGIKALLSGLTRRVLGEEGAKPLETGRAAVANQLANTLLRAIEQERRQRELEEIAGRVEVPEEVLKGRRTG